MIYHLANFVDLKKRGFISKFISKPILDFKKYSNLICPKRFGNSVKKRIKLEV